MRPQIFDKTLSLNSIDTSYRDGDADIDDIISRLDDDIKDTAPCIVQHATGSDNQRSATTGGQDQLCTHPNYLRQDDKGCREVPNTDKAEYATTSNYQAHNTQESGYHQYFINSNSQETQKSGQSNIDIEKNQYMQQQQQRFHNIIQQFPEGHLPHPTLLNLQFIQKHAVDILEMKKTMNAQHRTLISLQKQLLCKDEQLSDMRREMKSVLKAKRGRDHTSKDKHKRYKKSSSTTNRLSSKDVEQFLIVWNNEYICRAFTQGKCQLANEKCHKLHYNKTTNESVIASNLKMIADSKNFDSSVFFSKFYVGAHRHNMNCVNTVNALKRHINEICLI
jgi:hypothetical protein